MRSTNAFDDRNEVAYQSSKQDPVLQWRRLHAAIFFVFICLLATFVTLVQFGAIELVKVMATVPQAETPAGD